VHNLELNNRRTWLTSTRSLVVRSHGTPYFNHISRKTTARLNALRAACAKLASAFVFCPFFFVFAFADFTAEGNYVRSLVLCSFPSPSSTISSSPHQIFLPSHCISMLWKRPTMMITLAPQAPTWTTPVLNYLPFHLHSHSCSRPFVRVLLRPSIGKCPQSVGFEVSFSKYFT